MDLTAAEIVLRHWQFIYNKYWKKSERDLVKCPYPCTKDTLIHILEHNLERLDLVDLVRSDRYESCQNNSQIQINSNVVHSQTQLKQPTTHEETIVFGLNDLNKSYGEDHVTELSLSINESLVSHRGHNRKSNGPIRLQKCKVDGKYVFLDEFTQKSFV